MKRFQTRPHWWVILLMILLTATAAASIFSAGSAPPAPAEVHHAWTEALRSATIALRHTTRSVEALVTLGETMGWLIEDQTRTALEEAAASRRAVEPECPGGEPCSESRPKEDRK